MKKQVSSPPTKTVTRVTREVRTSCPLGHTLKSVYLKAGESADAACDRCDSVIHLAVSADGLGHLTIDRSVIRTGSKVRTPRTAAMPGC